MAGLKCGFGLRSQKRVPGIKGVVVEAGGNLAAELVHTRFREDFDAAIAKVIVLGRERIRVDANLANRRLGRQRASRKTIDVDLAAVGTGGRAGQGLQVVLEFVRIVGEHIQILALDDERARILVRGHFDAGSIIVDRHLLHLGSHAQLDVDAAIAAHRKGLHLIDGKALFLDHDVVGARGKSRNGEMAKAIAGNGLNSPSGGLQHDRSARHDRPRRIEHLAFQAGLGRLRHTGRGKKHAEKCREYGPPQGPQKNTLNTH